MKEDILKSILFDEPEGVNGRVRKAEDRKEEKEYYEKEGSRYLGWKESSGSNF